MLLELTDIKKHFMVRKGILEKPIFVRAVDGVSLRVRPQENFGLVGESGCGKTTLSRLMLRLLRLDGGTIVFDGKDITHMSERALRLIRPKMQVVFQDPYSSLDPRFTIRKVMDEPLRLLSNVSGDEKRRRVIQALRDVQLPTDILERFPHEFSGGERQRIAIARTLVTDAKFLILDEAVSSLDVIVQDDIIRLLKGLQKNKDITYFFISHNLRTVQKLCSRVAVMYQGKLVEEAPIDRLFSVPQHVYTRQLLSAALNYEVTETPVPDFQVDDTWFECTPEHFVRSPRKETK